MRKFLSFCIPSYKDYWRRANDFKGRTRRIEYWGAVTVSAALSFAVYILGKFLNDPVDVESELTTNIMITWGLINLIPGISLEMRRLRDAGAWIWWPIVLQILKFSSGFTNESVKTYLRYSYVALGLFPLYYACQPSFDKKLEPQESPQ